MELNAEKLLTFLQIAKEQTEQNIQNSQETTEFFWYGAVAWCVIGVALILIGITLFFRRGSEEKMTGAQYSALLRESKKRPKRLLNEKYYDRLSRNNRKKQ